MRQTMIMVPGLRKRAAAVPDKRPAPKPIHKTEVSKLALASCWKKHNANSTKMKIPSVNTL